MNHILDLKGQSSELHAIFKKLRESNAILFLGAGASVGEKRYMSKEIIAYYESYLGKEYNEPNITKFLDILSADESFSRKHFDGFVISLLQKQKVTEAHKILASVPWREIITTNFDLLVETAYDEVANTANKVYDLKTIKNLKQVHYKESNTEVKYIKLNGCMQDTSTYPLAFSTDDFNKLKSFYKNVLNDLRNLSPEILFLSIGYSYTDAFGQVLLERFDDYNFRERKWMVSVDPFPNENTLAYLTKNRIAVIKCSFQDFFQLYKEWEAKQQETLIKKRGLSITDSKNQYVTFPPKLLLNLDGIVRQLSSPNSSKERIIRDSDFYRGEEPNFNVIVRNIDVIKTVQVEQFKAVILKVFETNHSTFVPIFFITGDFGIGKSTFGFRLIHELEKDAALDLVAFEILDFDRLQKQNIIELVNNCKSKNVVFYCDEVEIESYFKSLLDLQRELSIEQFQGCNVSFIVPIRENILERFKLNRTIPRSHEIKLNALFEDDELDDLLEKLKNAGLVEFRDAAEKKRKLRRIKEEYDADSFISLMAMITSGKHENDLRDSYFQLSEDAQKAFLYTALLHRFKLWMPASWLKQNISMTWDEFIVKIVKAEGKGILIQDTKTTTGTQPDLFFRTKHPIIAEKLVERFLPNKDKQFSFYEHMLRTIEPGNTNSYIANNLLKAFIHTGEYSDYQLNKLFDSGYTKLSDDPYFLLNYAINLQHRKTIPDLKRALDLLLYAESLLEYRNHRFIHRRGVISFELAKMFYTDDSQLTQTAYYLEEAKQLFITKRLLDPFSFYSYSDYIRLLIWELDNIESDEEDDVQKQIAIEDEFETAGRVVVDGIDRIDNLRPYYAASLRTLIDNKDYKQYLDEMFQDFRLKPYACILLHNYYSQAGEHDRCDQLLEEMEYYLENFEVLKFLFRHYGRNLHDPNIRIKFFRLSRENPNLERDNPLRYNYFNFMAESYNYQFNEGRRYLFALQNRFYNLNPEFDFTWREANGNTVVFEGRIIKNTGERFKAIKISNLQQTFKLVKGNYDKFVPGASVKVVLHFYLYGIMAEIVRLPEERNGEEDE